MQNSLFLAWARVLVASPKAAPCLGPNSCFMCTEHRQERAELIHVLHKDRRLADLPKISQPTLIIWGEHDVVFPMELAHRLKRHLGENAEMVIIENAGHAMNAEKPREMCNQFKSFLLGPLPHKEENSNNINGEGKSNFSTDVLK